MIGFEMLDSSKVFFKKDNVYRRPSCRIAIFTQSFSEFSFIFIGVNILPDQDLYDFYCPIFIARILCTLDLNIGKNCLS